MKVDNMASRLEFLKELSTSELDDILHNELQKETMDDDLIRAVLCILENREINYHEYFSAELLETAHKIEDSYGNHKKATEKTTHQRVLKVASILLLIGVLLFVFPRAVNAESFIETLTRWTDSIFEFFNPIHNTKQPEYVFQTDNPGLQQIYDAVVDIGVTDPVVPMWVPDGYEITECKHVKTPKKTGIHARLKHSTNEIIISVDVYNADIVRAYAKNNTNVAEMEISGVVHYIFSNNEIWVAVWNAEGAECSVSIDSQEDDLYKILKSIYMDGD